MNENQLAKEIVDAAYQIHTKLGSGLFESVYEVVLAHELKDRGLAVERQKAIPIRYDDLVFDEGFRADIVVNNSVIIELKSIETVKSVHKKQLLTYLRLSNMKLGLLVNFGAALIKNGIFRVVNGLEEKNLAPWRLGVKHCFKLILCSFHERTASAAMPGY